MDIVLKNQLENELRNKYVIKNNEWVQVYITPLNRIDITIVCDQIKDSEEEVEGFIKGLIENSNSEELGYSIGFLEIYPTDEAEYLGLEKHKIKENPVSWVDFVKLDKINNGTIQQKKDKPYQVISFYSYKGGVGRTTSMIQVAYILAREGKRVLLLDMDIEAPSLHKLFKKQMDDPLYGVKHGLVDYFHERFNNSNGNTSNIKTTELFTEIEFNESMKGKLFAIPAMKELNNQYIFKLTQLQANIIYENQYLEDLLDELEMELKFDTVLIDCRTGVNQWGAFSLFGFSDQMVFIAYPNEENMEGLRVITSLMEETGQENYVVAISKIDPSTRGAEIAQLKFKQLNISQQDPIKVPYNAAIAMADEYPVKEVLEPYKELSQFILDNEQINFNRKYLNHVDVEPILKELIDESANPLNESQAKAIYDDNVSIIISNNDDEREHLLSKIKSHRRIYPKVEICKDTTFTYSIRKVKIFDERIRISLKEYVSGLEEVDWFKFWIAYLFYMINDYVCITHKETILINGLKNLSGKPFNEYINEVNVWDEKTIITAFINCIQGEVDGTSTDRSNSTIFIVSKNTMCVLTDLTEMIDSPNNHPMVNGLIDCIKFIKKNIKELRVLAFVNYKTYEKYQNSFIQLKGSIQKIEWKEQDINTLLEYYLDISLFKDYLNKKFKEPVERDESTDQLNITQQEGLKESDEEIYISMRNLFWGIRVDSNKYSPSVTSWFYDKIKNIPNLSAKLITSIFNKAIEYELVKNEQKEKDRLVTIESLEKSIESFRA